MSQVGLDISSEVWIRAGDAEVWQSAVVKDIDASRGIIGVIPDLRDGTGERVEVPDPACTTGRPQLHLRNEALKRKGALAFNDLGKLPILHEPAVLHALQVRFDEGIVYTNTGSILLAVNPFRQVKGLYDEAKLQEFSDLVAGEEMKESHVFSVANAAYQGVWQQQIPQTVLISGESGAGKTETTKFVMQFLAKAGSRASDGDITGVQKQVLQSIPLLEALGNAKTKRNDNSSRFGKYIELHFALSAQRDHAPRLVGAKMIDYLLEKVRVTDIQEGERSYHIFYQALAAAARKQTEGKAGDGAVLDFNGVALKCVAGKRPADFAYLRKSSETQLKDLSTGELEDEAKKFNSTLAAFRAFEVAETEVSDVLNTLIAVMYLGNVKFSVPERHSEGSMVEAMDEADGPLAIVARLLAVDPTELADAFCKKTRQLEGKAVPSPVSVDKASDSRDALARHLYSAIFAFVVERVNGALQRTSARDRGSDVKFFPAVGVLDIFGFEIFDTNSFEQLCINYTNEKLQQYFNMIIFEEEARLYEKEGIRWNTLDFPQNNTILKVIGEEPNGILPLLHSETIGWRTGNKEEERKKEKEWVDKMDKQHGKILYVRPNGEQRKLFRKQLKKPENFIVEHFAGEVEYASEAFLEKNRDELSEKLVQCMKGSSSPFIRERSSSTSFDRTFGAKESVSSQTGRRSVTMGKKYSVASDFRGQLEGLMERIRTTAPHFVRCIKPNMAKVPYKFDRRSVVEQLQYQGVLQAIEVSRAGYPLRLLHRRGVLDYRCLASYTVRNHLETQIRQKSYASAARELFTNLRDDDLGLTDDNWAVGATQIFLKRTGMEALSVALSRQRRYAATRIQADYRSHFYQCQFQDQRAAALQIQVAARGHMARRRMNALRRERAARLIQRCERGRVGRYICRERLDALKVLQAKFKAVHQRSRFVHTVRLIVNIQVWLRFALPRIRKRRLKMHGAALAEHIWRLWRGHKGRQEFREAKAAQLRLQHASSRLHHHWRQRVCKRLMKLRRSREIDAGAAAAHENEEYIRTRDALLRPAQVIEEQSPTAALAQKQQNSVGALLASTSAMRELIADLNFEVQTLRSHNQMLSEKATEFKRWTPKGLLLRFVCGGGSAYEPATPTTIPARFGGASPPRA